MRPLLFEVRIGAPEIRILIGLYCDRESRARAQQRTKVQFEKTGKGWVCEDVARTAAELLRREGGERVV